MFGLILGALPGVLGAIAGTCLNLAYASPGASASVVTACDYALESPTLILLPFSVSSRRILTSNLLMLFSKCDVPMRHIGVVRPVLGRETYRLQGKSLFTIL